jgi:hypothetical protein
MSYHAVGSCTLSQDERRAEALELIKIIEDCEGELHGHERDMIARVSEGATVSVKMLFWLRDIKDRVIA